MTEIDRHLFAFASYNAGPNRIAAMRRRAAKQGLDPNVWFQNVEVLAAKEIGRETRSVREQHLQVLRGLQARAGKGILNKSPTSGPMSFGMIGLGRMGGNMVRRLMRGGHACVAYGRSRESVEALVRDGATGAFTLQELATKLAPPRAVCLMIPAAAVDATIHELAPLLAPGDTIIDGGNSHYQDDIARAKRLAERGIHYVDVRHVGGVWGLERGYCLMIGGERDVVARLEPIFETLAPGPGSIPRTPGRETKGGTAERGYLHCGPAGAGHFVKMIHNGIEYGLMAAYAEGFNILRHAGIGREPAHTRRGDGAAEAPGALRVRPRSRRHRGSVAARQRGDVVAARSHRDGPREGWNARALRG